MSMNPLDDSGDDFDWFWGPGGDVDQIEPANRVVIDGEHYMLGDNTAGMKGFGGRRFDIEFFDGRRVTTTDLWFQGVIPPKWRERFPDNARFVQPEIDAVPREQLAQIILDAAKVRRGMHGKHAADLLDEHGHAEAAELIRREVKARNGLLSAKQAAQLLLTKGGESR